MARMINAKETWWNHFLHETSYHGYKMTVKRLENIKDVIWADTDFWDDILNRHSASRYSPSELKEKSPRLYEHCMGNMAGMLMQTLIEQGEIPD